MIRAITTNGDIFIGLTRASLQGLERGEQLLSPSYDGVMPRIIIEFAETDTALRDKLVADGRMSPETPVVDKRSS